MTVAPYPNDPVNPNILETAGSDLIYRQASGLEKALSDVEAQRLIAIYAELVRDQWDPQAISYQNLPYLAWAVGVNLWEADWDETFRRWWVGEQWTLKAQRGSEIGLRRFVSAVGAVTKHVTRPPARTYPLRKDTDEERAAYVARFPQLRMYPYVARVMLPWIAYGAGPQTHTGTPIINQKNGAFLGPLRPLYPTVQNQGGNFTRTSKLWDRGVETNLTMRRIVNVQSGEDAGWGFTPGVSAYDEEVVLPLDHRVQLLKSGIYLNGGAKYGVFPNEATPLRTITIGRSGKLQITQAKAQYQTLLPQVELINIEPEKVATIHPIRPTELYASHGCFLNNKFLPPSNAWQFMYEKWYIFDADRVPDYRRTGVYLDHTRLGMPKYQAEAKISITTFAPRWLTQTSGYIYGYLSAKNNEPINKVRRAVTASMALRDTVLIDTRTVRTLQVGDIINASGRVNVGQLVSA